MLILLRDGLTYHVGRRDLRVSEREIGVDLGPIVILSFFSFQISPCDTWRAISLIASAFRLAACRSVPFVTLTRQDLNVTRVPPSQKGNTLSIHKGHEISSNFLRLTSNFLRLWDPHRASEFDGKETMGSCVSSATKILGGLNPSSEMSTYFLEVHLIELNAAALFDFSENIYSSANFMWPRREQLRTLE